MATIPQLNLFSWENIDAQSDLRRLEFVLEALPDERLMQKLERIRGRGRNDFPVRAMWNSLIAGLVFEHNSIEALRRELMRNGELRQVCGFDLHLGSAAVPTARAYSSFLKALFKCTDQIEAMFDQLVQKLTQLLPDFGECLAVDSKAISSFSTRKNKHTKADGRRDLDADWGRKDYKGVGKNSKSWKKITKWFGYKLHLVVDSTYEISVAFDLTRASKSDQKNLLPLIEKIKQTHPQLVERAEHLSADRGYDSEEHNRTLLDDYDTKPIIDIRHMWKDPDQTRPVFPDRADNIVYDQDGTIFCVCPKTDQLHQMTYNGFEKHTTRGMKKMRLKVGLAMVVMLSLSVGSIQSGRKEKMRSLVSCLPKRAVA